MGDGMLLSIFGIFSTESVYSDSEILKKSIFISYFKLFTEAGNSVADVSIQAGHLSENKQTETFSFYNDE